MSGIKENSVEIVSDINSSSKQNGDSSAIHENHKDIPLVFFQESSLFGKQKVNSDNYNKHEEMYFALGSVIEPTHITGLQRVNGMWRIYIDNLVDKATLVASEVTIREKTLPILQSNPQRLDYENTTRIRIQNIPLSVDDETITRVLILKGLDIISSFREKLRINNKLTNCQTGDRLINVKTSSLKEPLNRFMHFGQFKAKVIHRGQVNTSLKCAKCLDFGHTMRSCTNDWKCSACFETGHKKAQCGFHLESSPDNLSEPSDTSEIEDSSDGEGQSRDFTTQGASQCKTDRDLADSNNFPQSAPRRKNKRKTKKINKQQGQNIGQPNIEQFMKGKERPNKHSTGSVIRSPPTPAEILNNNTKKSCN